MNSKNKMIRIFLMLNMSLVWTLRFISTFVQGDGMNLNTFKNDNNRGES